MRYAFLFVLFLSLMSCKPDEKQVEHFMTFSFKFDPTQERLNNLGMPAEIPPGHAAQDPVMREMAIHYIELSPNIFTPLGQGAVLYIGEEKQVDGQAAIIFDKVLRSREDSVFYKVNLKNLPPGTYEYVRVSVAAQLFDFRFNVNNAPVVGQLNQELGSFYSILGFNNYITKLTPYSKTITVNGARKQGFWALETRLAGALSSFNAVYSGQAPEGATTVVNPLFATSPVPAGSCVVTGKLSEPLVISGNESHDINMVLSFSVNKSLEWKDTKPNGQLDLDASTGKFEEVVDMGLRGLKPYIKK